MERGYGPDTWVTDQTGDMGDSRAAGWVTEGRRGGDCGVARWVSRRQDIGDWRSARGDSSAETSVTIGRETGDGVVGVVAGDVRDMGDTKLAGCPGSRRVRWMSA